MMLTQEHADWYYRCGQTQARADDLGRELREAIDGFEARQRERMLIVNKIVESAAVATSAATPTLSDNKLVQLIRFDRRLNKTFNKLSPDGRRRVLRLANGTDFLLAETLQDVLEQERGN